MLVKSVELTEDYRNLKKGFKLDLKDVTLLVGDQGCGKSSLLNCLRDNEGIKVELVDSVKDVTTYYFDTEKMNPRITDPQMYTTSSGQDVGIGYAAGLTSRFQSHGEVLREFTVNRIKEAKDCILFLDEPETALSLRNQYQLAQELMDAHKRNVQLVVATHCLPVISCFYEVYSLEHSKWMTSKEYIEINKKK